MKRFLEAQAVKDGYHVTVTETHHAGSLTEVYDMIRYLGLNEKEFTIKNPQT